MDCENGWRCVMKKVYKNRLMVLVKYYFGMSVMSLSNHVFNNYSTKALINSIKTFQTVRWHLIENLKQPPRDRINGTGIFIS